MYFFICLNKYQCSHQRNAHELYRRKINLPFKINEKSFVLDRNLLAGTKFHACTFMRVISWTRPARQQAISRPATPTVEKAHVASYIDEVEGMMFYSVPITIRLLYQFHFLKSIFTGETGRAAITSAIRKSEYDFQCGQRTLMPETAPLWSTTFHFNYLSVTS